MTNLKRHPIPEDVTTSGWTLSVTGTVDETLQLSYEDLEAFSRKTDPDTFHCEEGWVAEGLEWRGVPVEHILEDAEPLEQSAFGLVRAMDGDYACSFPLDRLTDCLLAVGLDGEPLDPAHGGPARLVPPNDERDCWESVKWVTEIELRERAPTDADTAKDRALARLE